MGNTLSAAVTTDSEDAALIARFRTLAPQLADALEAAQASRLVLGHDVNWWKLAWDKATDGKLEGYHELGRKVAAAEEDRDEARVAMNAATAALREERLNGEMLRERLASLERVRTQGWKERDAVAAEAIRNNDAMRHERDAAEARAKAAEERARELEAALEPLADMQLFSEYHAIGAITADQVRAARRALGRPE